MGKKRKKGGRRKPFARRYERHLADTKLSTSFTVPFDVWASLYATLRARIFIYNSGIRMVGTEC